MGSVRRTGMATSYNAGNAYHTFVKRHALLPQTAGGTAPPLPRHPLFALDSRNLARMLLPARIPCYAACGSRRAVTRSVCAHGTPRITHFTRRTRVALSFRARACMRSLRYLPTFSVPACFSHRLAVPPAHASGRATTTTPATLHTFAACM